MTTYGPGTLTITDEAGASVVLDGVDTWRTGRPWHDLDARSWPAAFSFTCRIVDWRMVDRKRREREGR